MISLQRMKSKLILQIGFHLIKMNKKKHPKKGAFENGLVNV
jgi:hypothetical protein